MATIGENLRRIRKARGVGQVELAEASGVAQPTISDIERGRREPHPATLRKLADPLGAELAEFFAQEHPPTPPKAPLTDEPEDRFNKRFATPDADSAEALHKRLDAELDKLLAHVRGLEASGIGDGDLRLKQARRRRAEGKRRTLAAGMRATDLALNADFGRDMEIHDTVAAYIGKAQETAESIEAENTEAHPEAS